jgi:membrane protein
VRRGWAQLPRCVQAPPRVVTRTIRLYLDDDCSTYAASIAFHALFSLVPLSLITLSILGLVIDQQRVVDFIYNQVPLKETQSVRDNVDEIVARARGISWAGLSFGVLALLWAGTSIFSSVRRGLNATYSERKGRPYWHGKLIDFALIFSFGVLILASIVATAMLQVVIDKYGPDNLAAMLALRISTAVATGGLTFILFSALYRLVPTRRPTWREAIIGAAFAAFLFEVLKNIAAILLQLAPFTRETAIYAGFSTAFAFLFWMYLNATILLLGAEFGRATTHEFDRKDPEATP